LRQQGSSHPLGSLLAHFYAMPAQTAFLTDAMNKKTLFIGFSY